MSAMTAKANSNKPPVDGWISPDVLNSCQICGHRTNLVGNSPDLSYMIEECSNCGQVHHFREDEEDVEA